MLRKLLFSLCIVLTSWSLALAQVGRLQGVISDKDTGEPIPFANIILENGGTQVGGASSDFDGNYDINPIPPGTYDLKATFVGYNTFIMKGVVISPNKITFQDVSMSMQSEMLDAVEVVDYKVPLISKDQTSVGATLTAEEIAKMPNRSADAVAASVGGVFSSDGEVGSMRGARSEGTVYYVDGVRVIGSKSVPQSAIDQVEVLLSGTPAMYGDATGGIINMTTKGPSRTFGAGVELETSEFLAGYGHNSVGLNVQGPLIKGKKSETALLGFFLSGEFTYNRDGYLSAIGHYKATDEWLNYIEQNPIRVSGTGSGTYQNGLYTRMGSMEYIKNSQNTAGWSTAVTGNINVRTTETINLTFGGSFNKSRANAYSRAHAFFNSDKNALTDSQTWRVYGRFTQRFPTPQESTSLIKNFYYTLQADYTRYNYTYGDPDHWDDIWKYGYLGKYTIYKTRSYELGSDTVNGHYYDNVWVLNSWDYDTLVTFDRSEFNPLLANYTSSYYDLYTDPLNHYQNFTDLELGGALLNSSSPNAFYGLYAPPGYIQTNYGFSESDQFAINLSGAMTVGNHELTLGFSYEQRNERGYGISGYSMWYLMRNLANFHIEQLDLDNPEVISYDGFVDTIIYHRKYDEASQYQFDYNLREALGLNPNGTDWINIDSYDFNDNSIQYYDENGVMKTAYLNDGFDLSLFTPDELTQDGNSYVSYYGYDYLGNKLKSQPSFDDFFTEVDENGNYTRPVGSFRPIYMAGYIQDKFAFKDLIFNIGLRVDRFDANQKVLKDPYILYDYYTVGDKIQNGQITLDNGTVVDVPDNIGDDFAMYVNKTDDITSIVGYRSDNVWYNAEGAEISDPTTLDVGSGVSPWVKDASQQNVNSLSFKDYDPQWSVMPRISFSFPISDEALFFAHYDVLTQRPSNIFCNIYTYYYFSQISDVINNPSLKPSQTIDYELGFTQKLTNTSSMTISAYYREIRNMIQMYRYTGAYPKDYSSYSNLDFGTVKGVTASYDLRRTKNVRLRASYTLQFTNATGASTTTMSALIAAGVPNLRSTFPMPWDRRHQFNIMVDYRFSSGKDYNGPVTKREKSGKKPIQWLSNTGFNLTMNGGSGTPYTAQSNINSPISAGTNLLKGSYYGSRLPWAFRFDIRVDKDIDLKLGKKDSENKRDAYLNVYLQVLNLLNSKNIISVYSSTGNPDDDGYLSAPEWQREIQNQTDPAAYYDLYSLYVNNAANYSQPRQIRVGLIFNF